jgi:hypothetical protein
MQHALAALPADPRASVRLGLSVHQHRNGPIHPRPAVAVTMLQSWVALAQHPELSRVDHPDLRIAGLLLMIPNVCSTGCVLSMSR